MANFGWDYPPGVTGNEPQITGIIPGDDLADQCLDLVKEAEKLIEEAFGILDDQGVALPQKCEEGILSALEYMKDEINWKRPMDYDPMDDRI